MTKILFIDDEDVRVAPAEIWYERNYGPVSEFKHIVNIPQNFWGYDVVSFDNDLINEDTVREIRRRLFQEGNDSFIEDFEGVSTIVIHSMNPIASKLLYDTFKAVFADTKEIRKVSFNEMLKSV